MNLNVLNNFAMESSISCKAKLPVQFSNDMYIIFQPQPNHSLHFNELFNLATFTGVNLIRYLVAGFINLTKS